ncbi:MAG: hypothetical protein H7Y11_11475, partial [Armatimonadetes bacterium]|nr:hypothetical protein [Anaerolineae bacterium]
MAANRIWMVLACIVLAACAVQTTPPVLRLALLAPFEGRYREVGYEALYAARLALREGGYANLELLPIDDGGGSANAVQRAHALASYPTVKAVLLIGYPATDSATQTALSALPALIIGEWGATPATDQVWQLSHPALRQMYTAPPRADVLDAATLPAPIIGGDAFALRQFPKLRADLAGVTVISSAALPDADFTQRYLASAQFAPQPGLWATLTYDAAHIAARAMTQNSALGNTDYSGINGRIQFADGYWLDAP